MTWYTLFPDADKRQVNGSAITAISTKYKGGTIFALGTALPADTVATAFVQLGNRAAVHGSQVVQSKDVFGAIHTAPVAITSVADDGSGFCDYTLTTHGLVVGQVINVTGSTSGNLDGPQKITSVPDPSSFVTDRAYVASATAGNYTLVSGRFASMTAGEYLIRGYTLGGGGSPISVSLATYGSDFGIRRSIHKLEHMRTRRVATAIRAGNWNIYTGQFTTAPTVADDAPTWGTDEAANPTRAIPGELVYRHSGMPDGTYGPVQKDYPAKTNG